MIKFIVKLLKQKIAQLAPHGLSNIHTSFSYHFPPIFDLHNYGLILCSLKNLKKHQKGPKNPQEGLKTPQNS